MCPGARHAEQDFCKLVGQRGLAMYSEEFLIEGISALPRRYQSYFPGLACWRGVAGFKQDVRNFVTLPDECPVLLAGQSQSLIHLAAECLCRVCRSVLLTDLLWPPYLSILKRVARRRGVTLHIVPLWVRLKDRLLNARTLRRFLLTQYKTLACDGLMLSDITSTGVRIPLEHTLRDLNQQAKRPRFVVIDGAQALNHRPLSLNQLRCDIYLTGTQKWLGAYHPLRMALVRRRPHFVHRIRRELQADSGLVDPLLEFTEMLQRRRFSAEGETVNVTALIAAAGALAHWRRSHLSTEDRWQQRLDNRALILRWLHPYLRSVVHDSMASGTILLPHRQSDLGLPLRRALSGHGIVASTSIGGHLRLSMPSRQLGWQARSHLVRGAAPFSTWVNSAEPRCHILPSRFHNGRRSR